MPSTHSSDAYISKINMATCEASEATSATAKDEEVEEHSCCRSRRERFLQYARCAVSGTKGAVLAILMAVLFAQVYLILLLFDVTVKQP